MSKYYCSSEEFEDVVDTIEADHHNTAAEEFVDNNLDFNPSDPQSNVEVTVVDADSGDTRLIDVLIELSWKPIAQD
jgi:hypothetical protein